MKTNYKKEYLELKIESLNKDLAIPASFLSVGIFFIPLMMILNGFEWGWMFVGGILAFLGGIKILSIRKEIKKLKEKESIAFGGNTNPWDGEEKGVWDKL